MHCFFFAFFFRLILFCVFVWILVGGYFSFPFFFCLFCFVYCFLFWYELQDLLLDISHGKGQKEKETIQITYPEYFITQVNTIF